MNITTRIIIHDDAKAVGFVDQRGNVGFVDTWKDKVRYLGDVPDASVSVEQVVVMPPARLGQRIEVTWPDGDVTVDDLLGWLVDVSPEGEARDMPRPIVAPHCSESDALGLIDYRKTTWRLVGGDQ